MPELRYLNLETTDAAFNLAAEQYVFDCLPRDRMYFMLWQNRSAVIIGKYRTHWPKSTGLLCRPTAFRSCGGSRVEVRSTMTWEI